jgi:hypothetical protein
MSYPVMSTTVPWSLVKGGFKKTPHFNTLRPPTPAAGKGRAAIALMPYPTWDFAVDLNLVPGGEAVSGSVLQSFLGCYMACCGGGNFFLFTDPNDSTVTQLQSCLLNVTPGAASPMGIMGDGVSKQFQTGRTIGAGVDILQNVTGTVYVNGSPAPGSWGATGIYTFTTAPANGSTLTWAGTFQYLCQFKEDTLSDLARVNKNAGGFLWSCGSIAFESVFV